MKGIIFALAMILFGGFITWSSAWSIRNRAHRHSITVLEALILRMTGEEPLPKARLDIWLSLIQQWLGIVIGPAVFLLGLLVLASEFGFL